MSFRWYLPLSYSNSMCRQSSMPTSICTAPCLSSFSCQAWLQSSAEALSGTQPHNTLCHRHSVLYCCCRLCTGRTSGQNQHIESVRDSSCKFRVLPPVCSTETQQECNEDQGRQHMLAAHLDGRVITGGRGRRVVADPKEEVLLGAGTIPSGYCHSEQIPAWSQLHQHHSPLGCQGGARRHNPNGRRSATQSVHESKPLTQPHYAQ